MLNQLIQRTLFIVDNGSSDGTQDYIRENYPKAILTISKKNLGFGRANNLGLQYAIDHGYDYVYLLNQDAWIFPNTVKCLIDINKKDPTYGVLSPFQLQANMHHLDFNFNRGVCSWYSNSNILDNL
jgi:GT2 family glycosyltransferase